MLRLLQRHAARADLAVQPEFVSVLDRGLLPALEPEVVGRRGMPTQPERDEVILNCPGFPGDRFS
jgi:hypothetical protein